MLYNAVLKHTKHRFYCRLYQNRAEHYMNTSRAVSVLFSSRSDWGPVLARTYRVKSENGDNSIRMALIAVGFVMMY